MKAYWINATAQTISAVEYSGLADLHRMIDGYIELAKMWPDRTVLYVDEEGLFKQRTAWFSIAGKSEPLAGNGVVVGPEIGDSAATADPGLTLEALRGEVRFLTAGTITRRRC
jgi:uncharacterized protein DUF3846